MTSLCSTSLVKNMSQAGSQSKEHWLPHEVLGHPVLPAIPHTKCGTPMYTTVYTSRHGCSEGMSPVERPQELLLPELLFLTS